MRKVYLYIYSLLLFACSPSNQIDRQTQQLPSLLPDYADVTVPCNIAPLNFTLPEIQDGFVRVCGRHEEIDFRIRQHEVSFPLRDWQRLLRENSGNSLQLTVVSAIDNEHVAYAPFSIHVASDSIDPYLVYRLIEPGYEMWNEMGIYQRNLQNFEEEALFENKLTERNCVNCHSFKNGDPQEMLLHLRASSAGTYIIREGKTECLQLDPKTGIKALVYPFWHPQGRYVAFSSNETRQAFHVNDPNRVEVFDLSSDVVVYDTREHRLLTAPELFSNDKFQTFPSFSPDGKWLYYCSAQARQLPESYRDVHYNICRVGFDADKGRFSHKVDTLFSADTLQSASFPRLSPDGRYMLFTRFAYGNFSIWHKEADLSMIDLETGERISLDSWNSPDTESYHSWSSNSRWVVFSSRRIDGLYTRPFIGYLGADGVAKKPFLLPQKTYRHYQESLKSYNIPELITKKATLESPEMASQAKKVLIKRLEVEN